jgi:Arc/MetJ family transcription regulator
MRTNIVLDDDLVAEAMKLSQITTKRQVVEQALAEFVAFRKRLDVRELKGSATIRDDYDHKALRGARR